MQLTSQKKITAFILLLGILFPVNSWATMSSTNFVISSDYIGVGGALSSSTSFSIQESIAENAGGTVTSANFVAQGGYQAMDQGMLSMTLSNNTLDLGTLSTSQVKNASSQITVSTDSLTGYTLAIGTVSGTGLSPVSDGAVTAGSEEYGLAASGSDSLISSDVAITPSLALASTSTPVRNGSPTTITIKAAISNSSASAAYNQTITLISSANL